MSYFSHATLLDLVHYFLTSMLLFCFCFLRYKLIKLKYFFPEVRTMTKRKKNKEMFVFKQRQQRIVNERWWKFEPKLGSKHVYFSRGRIRIFHEPYSEPVHNFFFFLVGSLIIRHVSLLCLPIPTKTGSKLYKAPIRKFHWAHTKYHSPSSG